MHLVPIKPIRLPPRESGAGDRTTVNHFSHKPPLLVGRAESNFESESEGRKIIWGGGGRGTSVRPSVRNFPSEESPGNCGARGVNNGDPCVASSSPHLQQQGTRPRLVISCNSGNFAARYLSSQKFKLLCGGLSLLSHIAIFPLCPFSVVQPIPLLLSFLPLFRMTVEEEGRGLLVMAGSHATFPLKNMGRT